MDKRARSEIANDLADCPDYYWTELSPYPTSLRALGAMVLAREPRGAMVASSIENMPRGRAPRWPSTVSFIDRLLGGFYGLATVAGTEGLGKSLLARASAIEAAATLNWNVVLFDAENAPDELGVKLDQYLDAHPQAEDAIPHLKIVHVPRGWVIEDFIGEIAMVCADDRPVLVVLDSINTCAELAGRPYLDTLRELSLWAMMARRISRACASFLVLSEQNRAGGAKGEKLNYWSDVFVKMNGDRKAAHLVMKIHKTRSTAGEKEERKLVRLVHIARFLEEREMIGEQAHLHPVVTGGATPALDPEEGDLF